MLQLNRFGKTCWALVGHWRSALLVGCMVHVGWSSLVVASELSLEQLRTQYGIARPQLVAYWNAPAHYSVRYSIHRSDIPQKQVGFIKSDEATTFDVYGQDKKWRLDVNVDSPQKTSIHVVTVSTPIEQFQAKKLGAAPYKTEAVAQSMARTNQAQQTIHALCGAAFILPNRIDVEQILIGPNYRVTVDRVDSPSGESGQPSLVHCDFERTPRSDPSGQPRTFFYESGRLTFRPNDHWALDRYSLLSNTGIHYEGHVDYQTVVGLVATLPKRAEFTTTENRSTLKTHDLMEMVAIVPGPIDEKLFQLSRLQDASDPMNHTKLAETWRWPSILITLGVIFIIVTLILRVGLQRRSAER